jgi:hypothetical protein
MHDYDRPDVQAIADEDDRVALLEISEGERIVGYFHDYLH